MPSKQPKLLSRKDNYDMGSQVSVVDKYGKRKRKVNTRPEGNYQVIRVPSNPDGEVLAGGGYEAMFRRRRMEAPRAVTVNASDFEELAALTEKEEKLQLTLQQFYFLISKRRFVWFCAGFASGKTLIGTWWVYMRIIQCPQSLGLIGANTHDQLNQSTLKPFMEFLDTIGMPYVINRQPPKEWGLPRLFKEYDNIMVFPNGAHVLLRSLDNPTNLAGLTLGWFWIDETAYSSPEIWKVIVSRLRCSKADVLMGRVTSTPEGQNWLYDIFKSDEELYKIIFQSVLENPFIPNREQFVRSQMAFMDDSQVEQYIHGRIVQVKFGRVYHQFSDKNVKEKYQYERRRELLLCWDFNSGAAPMSLIVAQRFFCPKSGRKQIQVIDEFIKEYSDTKEICALFIAKYGPNGKNHLGRITIYGDAYGDKTTSKSDYAVMKNELEIAFREELLSFDNIMGSNPEQQDRINAMNTGFRNSLGQRDIFIHPDCKKLIFDLNNVKPKDGDGIQIQKTGQTKIDKAKNIKLTHPSDAFGYLVVREIQVVKRNSPKAIKRNNVMIVGGQH